MDKSIDPQDTLREMLKGLKPQAAPLEIPDTLAQPPRGSHPDLHPDGRVKE
jgi:hypothetical protein